MSWRSLTQIGQQFNLDQQTLERAYAMQRAAGEQLSRLLDDPNISREDRRATADAINAELRNSMATVLGTEAATQFQNASPRITVSRGGDALTITTMPRTPLPAGSSLIINQIQRIP
jgi:hypothetical protein